MVQPVIMKVLRNFFLIFFCITYLNKSYAQSDYVITVKGDSIPCKVKFSSEENAKYKTDTMQKFKKINTDEFKEFFVSDETALYRAVYVDDSKKPIFLDVLEKGKIDLYQMEKTNYSAYGTTTFTTWYVGKGSDSVKTFKFNSISLKDTRAERKADFAKLLIDDKNVYDKFIADDKFSFNGIRNIIHYYNARENYKNRSMVVASGIDYVITKKNDTIHGRIKYDLINDYFTFTEKNKNDALKIDSSQIHEFFYAAENASFLLKILPETNAEEFVKCLEKGKVNLYEFAKSTGSRDHLVIKYYWFVNKGDGSLIAIKIDANNNYDIRQHKELLAAFRNIIADNKDILSNFNYDLNNAKSNPDIIIRSYINNYNKDYAENQTKK